VTDTEYEPAPIDTSIISLPEELKPLLELLCRNTHDVWARRRFKDGWRYGPERNDARKEHPSLIPYDELSESEKQYDREVVLEVLKMVIALGYNIESSEGERNNPQTEQFS
jgi:hypothetical protein